MLFTLFGGSRIEEQGIRHVGDHVDHLFEMRESAEVELSPELDLPIVEPQRWIIAPRGEFLIDFGPIEWGFSIPWLPYAQNLDETTYRDRGIRDGIAMARRLDGIILVGGEATRQSKGAAAEAEDYKMRSKPIYDLEPPLDARDVERPLDWISTECVRDVVDLLAGRQRHFVNSL